MATLTPEAARWQHLKALLHEAADLDANARAAFLNGLDDDALRADLDALLAAHDESEALDRFGAPALQAPAEVEAGVRIGPYRIEEEIGRGGMGTVYRAERADGQFEQTVALKLLPPSLGSAKMAERFRAERQILARLEHPHVARLLDGGVTEAGPFGREVLWLAMELVDGVPITDWADQHRFSVAERVRLFLQVCDAVAYAHRSLVVHRDLKPSNILVAETDQGTPSVKLLDFGIAKLIEDDSSDSTAQTQTGLRPMTPEYAAPEQVRGEPISTATDVYALGVVLYELLAGQRPYQLGGRAPSEIERTVCDTEPTRPSLAAREHGETLEAQRLEGDLDTIVLKALAKEPERRYAGAEALGADLRRHLDGLPVLARPATAGYRTRKFVRRHRAGVAATALATLALLVGLGTALWQGRVAAAERDRTAAALDRSERTLDFLRGMIVAGGAEEGDPDTPIGVVLDSAAVRARDLDDQPAVARAVHLTLGGVFHDLGRLDAAEEEASRALALFPEAERDAEYGRALHVLGMVRTGQDDYNGAVAYHEQALAYLPAPRSPAAAPDRTRLRAAALSSYADALTESGGREDDAEAAYREAIALYQAIGDPNAAIPLSGLAVTYNIAGRQEEALPLLREIVETIRRQFGRPHYRLGIALSNLGATLNDLGRYDEADPVLREAVEVMDETVGEEHPNAVATRVTFALYLRSAGHTAEAMKEGEIVLAAATRAFGPDHSLTAFAQNVAGRALCDGGDPERGAALLRASAATRRAVLPEGHWLVPNGESLLGECLARLGRDDEAERLLRSSYDALHETLGDEHVKTVEARDRLRVFGEAHGRSPEADGLGERP